jgi:hypothetical protein
MPMSGIESAVTLVTHLVAVLAIVPVVVLVMESAVAAEALCAFQ